MKALVTGATGFVGRHLVGELLSRGWECRCLVRNPVDAPKNGAELWPGDVTDEASIRGIARGVDAVFHLAACGGVTAVSPEERRKMHSVNVEGTRNMLVECADEPIARFVHFSSTAAMGCTGRIYIDEATPCLPVTAYQRSKFEAEKVVEVFAERGGVPAVIIRPCMIYGPGPRQGAFLKFCRMFKRGVFPRLPGRVFVPIVYVKDVAAAAIAAAERGAPGQIYLIAGSEAVDIHDLRRWVIDALKIDPPYIGAPLPLLKAAVWGVEVFSRIFRVRPPVTLANLKMTLSSRRFSTEKARLAIGFVASANPRQCVRETVLSLVDQGLL